MYEPNNYAAPDAPRRDPFERRAPRASRTHVGAVLEESR